MSGKQQDIQKRSDADSAIAKSSGGSQDKASTPSNSGYAEKHGPRVDADGWGEANAARSDRAGTSEDGSQGHAAGERSFDNGPDDTAAADAASDAALREPGERGPTDAQPSGPAAADEESPDESNPDAVDSQLSKDDSQRDFGQGGGQGYVHKGKPGAPGPDSP